MKKCFIIAAAFAAGTSFAGFPEDFQAAMKMSPAEAAGRFMELAKNAPDTARDTTLYQAGLNYIRLNKFPEAEAVSGQIKDSGGKLLRMQIMDAQGQTNKIIEQFRDEKIAQWSDEHQFDAYRIRAVALFRSGMTDNALADSEAAEKLSPSPLKKASIVNLRGMILTAQGKYEDALAEYRRNIALAELAGFGEWNHSVVAVARILIRLNKYEEALAELSKIKRPKSGYWAYTPLMVEAEVYRAWGKTAEAEAKSKEAEIIKKDGV